MYIQHNINHLSFAQSSAQQTNLHRIFTKAASLIVQIGVQLSYLGQQSLMRWHWSGNEVLSRPCRDGIENHRFSSIFNVWERNWVLSLNMQMIRLFDLKLSSIVQLIIVFWDFLIIFENLFSFRQKPFFASLYSWCKKFGNCD